MNNLLAEITKLFDKQTLYFTKRFDRLEKRVNGLRDRVTKIERKERVNKSSKVICVDAEQFKNTFLANRLETDLKSLKYTEASKIDREFPAFFPAFVESQFENPENCNLHLKGTRLYECVCNNWKLVSGMKIYLDTCRENLWVHFNDTCKSVYSDRDSWNKVFRPIIERNVKKKCPMSHSAFRNILSKFAPNAAKNRGLSK